MKIKNYLNSVHLVGQWAPLAFPYKLACIVSAPVSVQIALMPPPPTPLIVKVRLQSISLETHNKIRSPGFRFARAGDWDQSETRPLSTIDGPNDPESPFANDFHTIRDLCRDKKPLEEISEYQAMMQALKTGKQPRGCRSEDDIRNHFKSLERANASIRDEGYKTSLELGGMKRDEISVWITRDGQLAYSCWANHRLAMAILNNIETVPVSILGAHSEWLEEQCRKTSLPPHRAVQKWANAQQS